MRGTEDNWYRMVKEHYTGRTATTTKGGFTWAASKARVGKLWLKTEATTDRLAENIASYGRPGTLWMGSFKGLAFKFLVT
mmetsp:Transcript_22201/g.39360  ORF Transcript_22201/g.39360 Transcript_22201/m.39360 type:complete len:80 (-) Transcript_22201:1005-1244(-)